MKLHNQTTIYAAKIEHPGTYHLATEYYSTTNCTGKPLFINNFGGSVIIHKMFKGEYYILEGYGVYDYITQAKKNTDPSSVKCLKFSNLSKSKSIIVPIKYMKNEKSYDRVSKKRAQVIIL